MADSKGKGPVKGDDEPPPPAYSKRVEADRAEFLHHKTDFASAAENRARDEVREDSNRSLRMFG